MLRTDADPLRPENDNRGVIAIGRFIMSVSELEYMLDHFLFSCSNKYRKATQKLAQTYPAKAKEKADILVGLLLLVPELRTQPFSCEGDLDLNAIGYFLEEIFDQRNMIAHGASRRQDHFPDRVVIHFRKFRRLSRNTYGEDTFIVSDRGLEHQTERAKFFIKYLQSLQYFIDGKTDWETEYKRDCEIRENWRRLIEFGIAAFRPDEKVYRIDLKRVKL